MEDVWFTSDTHFGHKRILEFCPVTRLGKSVDEMDELLIQIWNKKVRPSDRIYHTGDFSFHSKAKTIDILSRLNGQIHLIEGNHDRQLESYEFKSRFVSKQIYKTITVSDQRFVLMHYPIASWDQMHRGTLHLHGHVHGGYSVHPSNTIKNRMDVGVDSRMEGDMSPYHIDEVLERIKLANERLDAVNDKQT